MRTICLSAEHERDKLLQKDRDTCIIREKEVIELFYTAYSILSIYDRDMKL